MRRGKIENTRRKQRLKKVSSLLGAVLIAVTELGSVGNLAGVPRVVRAADLLEAERGGESFDENGLDEILDVTDNSVSGERRYAENGEDSVIGTSGTETSIEPDQGLRDAKNSLKSGNPGSGSGDAFEFVEEIQEIDPADIPSGSAGGQSSLEGQKQEADTGEINTDALEELSFETELETESETESETEDETKADGSGNPNMAQGERVYLGIDNLHIYEGMEQSFSDGYSPVVQEGRLELVIPYVASGRLKGNKLTVDLEFAQQQETPCELKNYQKDVEKKAYRSVNGKMQETELLPETSGEGASSQAMVDPSKNEDGQKGSEADLSGTAAGSSQTGTDTLHSGAPAGAADPSCIEAYLYTCQVPVLSSAAPGQYSVTVKARGYSEAMELVKLDYQIFFRIPEPEPAPTQTKSDKKGKNNGNTGSSGGGYSGGGGYGDGAAEEEIIRQPKMLLESCNLAGRALEAGSQEDMQVALQNCSQSQAMYNLKVVLQMESTALNLERNSFYFEKVEPEETIDIQEAIGVVQNAEAGVVPLTFAFEYEDEKGNAATGTETMNLTITQPVKMELEKAEIPAQVYASDTIAVPVSVLNLSRTGVYNARVHLEGTGLFPTGDVFLGNMEAGSSGDGSMNVYVGTRTMEAIGTDSGTDDGDKYGPVRGTVTLAYEDASGETHEISQDYQTEIRKAQILSLNVEEEKSEGNPWWISVFAVVILGMAVLILLLALRLRRKNVILEEARKTADI